MLFHSTVMLAMEEHFFLNKGTYNIIYTKNKQQQQQKNPNPSHQDLKALNAGFIMPFVSVDFIIHLLRSLVLNISVKA